MTFRVLALFLILAAAGGGFAWYRHANSAAEVGEGVPTAVVESGRFERIVASIGEVKAARSAILSAPYNGTIVALVDEGVRVAEGDPIIWLQTDDIIEELKEKRNELGLAEKDLFAAREEYRLQELQNEYALQSEEARVEIAEQRYLDSQQKFEAERQLVEKSISPQSKLEEAELAMLSSGVELRSARINLQKTRENLASNLRIKQSNIDKQQLSLDRIEREIVEREEKIEAATIRAPTAGEVSYLKIWRSGTSSKVAEGDSVWPRSNLVEIPDRSQMMAVVPVNELDIALVEVGQPVQVRLEAVPGTVYEGVVDKKSIVPISDQTRRGWDESGSTGPREFEVHIKLLVNDDVFRQGMTASVRIEVQSLDSALRVPLEALSLFEDAVGVWTADGAPRFLPLKVLMTNDLHAAVTGDIANGDRIYLRDPRVEREDARDLSRRALDKIRARNGAASPPPEAAPAAPETFSGRPDRPAPTS